VQPDEADLPGDPAIDPDLWSMLVRER